MSNKYFDDVAEFNMKYNLNEICNKKPGFLDPRLMEFRLKFLQEELTELANSCGFLVQGHGPDRVSFHYESTAKRDLEKAFDALIDLQYVLTGTIIMMGMQRIFDEGWDRVQSANMQKIRVARPEDSKRGSGFDVVKPKDWKAPEFKDLLK